MKMNNINYLCGIDIGTGGAKIILVNAESGKIDFSVTKFYDLHTPKPLWAEQEPTDWWGAVCEGLQELTSKIDKKRVNLIESIQRINKFKESILYRFGLVS